jgi:dipeptidyl aminopeptidase/acylaminoacyl peptidase
MRGAVLLLVLGSLVAPSAARAADGAILERKPIEVEADAPFVAERVLYESDGLRILGFLAHPKSIATGTKLPCLLFNRGGNRDFGAWTNESFLARARLITGWGYVLFASSYRGATGSEGRDEFGGADVDDVTNALRVFDQLDFADHERIGMWGHSRGGMMTYLALARTDRIRAAVVGAGLADFGRTIKLRPEMEQVAAECIPRWDQERARAIEARSAVHWAERMPASTPILIVHGTGDWRVDPRDSLDMAQALYAAKRPFRLLLLEGGEHGLREFSDEYRAAAHAWLDRYVRDRAPLPDLTPHGD